MAVTIEGRFTVPADQATVWAGLNDPDVLKACIKGCQSFERTGDTTFAVTAGTRVGPIRISIKASIALQDIDAPHGCRIFGEGEGGIAGFAKGWADVRLAPTSEGTTVAYRVETALGGRLARLGGRMIDGAAKRMADQFFAAFAAAVAAKQGAG